MKFTASLLKLFSSNALLTAVNLVRDVSVATAFGAAAASDIFFLAISVPVFLMMANGNAFRSIAVPALGRVSSEGQDQVSATARRLLLTNGSGIFLVSVGLGILSTTVWWLRHGGQDTTASVAAFVVAILPMYCMAALIEMAQGPLQARGYFLLPGILRLGLPAGIICGALLSDGESLQSIAIVGTATTTVALMATARFLMRESMLPKKPTPHLNDDLRRWTLSGYWALVVSNLIAGANPVIDQWMAAPLGTGAISQLGYANRLIVGVAALLLAALGPLVLIKFSNYAGAGNSIGIERLHRSCTRATFWLGALATLATWLLADWAIALLYERGEFTPEDRETVLQLTKLYAAQFPFYWSAIAGGALVSALGLNRFFVTQGVVIVAVNIAGNFLLIRLIGLNGIAISTVFVAFAGSVLLQTFLQRQGHVRLTLRDLLEAAAASLLLACSWPLISAFHLELGPQSSVAQWAAALALMIIFAGLAALSCKSIIPQLRNLA